MQSNYKNETIIYNNEILNISSYHYNLISDIITDNIKMQNETELSYSSYLYNLRSTDNIQMQNETELSFSPHIEIISDYITNNIQILNKTEISTSFNFNELISTTIKDKSIKIQNETELSFSLYYELISDYITNNIQIINKTELIQNIINNLFNELNMTELDNGIDKKIIGKDTTFIFTSTINQKNNEDKNNITMNLGECENLIKKDYNISENDSLYILQIISEEEGMLIPKIEYEVYYPLYDKNNLTKLNLNSCSETKIEISISVKINDNIDKYNANSGYYNDICYQTTSDNGTDIPLKERRNDFINNNMTLCEENCELIGYDNTKQKAKCSCGIKLSIPENYDIKFNKKDFFNSFIDVKNIANLNILKCFKTVLKITSLTKNYGFFIFSIFLILYFITLFIFWNSSYNKIKKYINKMIYIFNRIEGNKEIKRETFINRPIKTKKIKVKIKRKKHFYNFKNI